MNRAGSSRQIGLTPVICALALTMLLSACRGTDQIPPGSDASRQLDRYTSSPELGTPTGPPPQY
jgi:hypothetical protein